MKLQKSGNNKLKILTKINENKYLFYLVLFGIFGVMFVLNHYTLYAADDYSYMYSFATQKKITSVWEIFPSMYAHAQTMNGRLIAHFFVQLFLLLPALIFDIINTIIFIMFVLILYKYLFWNGKINVLALIAIFALVWYFVPAFGQTMFWLDGSCNYLWGCTFSLYYLYPFIKILRNEKVLESNWKKILFVICGLAMGDYLETASFGTIILAILLLVAYKFVNKKAVPIWWIGSIVTMLVGFLLMMTSPGTMKNKVATSGLRGYVDNFINAMDMYMECLSILVIVLIVMIVCSIAAGYWKQSLLAIFFLMASLITNFMHTVASYYPPRNMFSSAIFLIVGVLILTKDLWDKKEGILITCGCWVLLIYFSAQFVHGSWDIYNTYEKCVSRDTIAHEQIEEGERNLSLPLIATKTKYAALYGLNDLNTEEADVWSNTSLARYYDVDSVIGILE